MRLLFLFFLLAALVKVVHAFSSSRAWLLWCACGLSRRNINTLQLIQNTPPGLIAPSERSGQITWVLVPLQRLTVNFRADFKVLKSSHLYDLSMPHEPDCCLRASSRALTMIPMSLLKGDLCLPPRPISCGKPCLRISQLLSVLIKSLTK